MIRHARHWRIALLLALVSPLARAAAPPARAQASVFDPVSIARPSLRVFTDIDGLPQNAITAVAYDHVGYLWAGTKDGLARYDGRSWKTVNLPKGTGSNWVQTLLVAADGSLWVGTGGGGISHYEAGRWTLYTESEGLPGNEVFDVLETLSPAGRPVLLAATGKGLGRFEDGRWRREVVIAGQPDAAIDALFETTRPGAPRELWVGTNIAGIARFTGGAWQVFDKSNGLPSLGATTFLQTTAIDGRDRLLAGTFGDGILQFDGQKWIRFAGKPGGVPSAIIHALREVPLADGTLTLWAGTDTGLDRLERGQWRHFGPEQGLPRTGVWSLAGGDAASDPATVWLGTAGLGLVQWQLGGWTSFGAANGLPSNSVYSVANVRGEDGENVLWVGTVDRGLARLERGLWTTFDHTTGLGDDVVWSLHHGPDADGRNALWVGTNLGGLRRFKDGAWTRYSLPEGLPHVAVSSLLETRGSDGSPALWIGTSNGLAKLERGLIRPPDSNLRLPEKRVRALLETQARDGSTTLWVGTDGGLARFEQGTTRHYGTNPHPTSTDLPASTVLSLHERRADGRRELWVGTRAGVSRLDLDASAATWVHLSTSSRPALPNDTVYRIEEDAQHRVYLLTNQGIARLTPRMPTADDPAVFDVYTFNTFDGLPSNECNTGASSVDSAGRIWAGTIAGLAVLDPGQEFSARGPRPLEIQSARLPDQERTLRPGEVLSHDENHVLFEFALLSFFREGNTRYRTQLKGIETEPSAWAPEASRNYFSLPAGQYLFRAWGRDAFGMTSGPSEIAFVIRPAPWLTWWAIVLYALVALGLARAALGARERALRRRTEELEAGIAERTTQLAQTVEELRASEQRAHDANRAKTTFLANMSHELRTPLNAILGFAQLMERDRGLAPSHVESLRIVSRSGEHLLGLINSVLSVAKIEAGTTSIDVQPFGVAELLRSVREMVRGRAEAKGLFVELDLDPTLPVVVRGDEGKLRQVLVNLLGNAVKFTTTGGVRLRVRWQTLEGDTGRAQFEVIDTGCGLTPDELAQLFQAFVQTESGRKAREGTGLGLVISRNLVELMGGRIEVESTAGTGSTFRFEVLLEVTSQGDRRKAERPRAVRLAAGSPHFRILVADDTTENRLLLTRLLEPIGFELREATNGAEALDLWREWRPHLILMDMRMPVMDGVGATQRIRETDRECRIIALTASAFDIEQEFFLSIGCDAYVPKPFQAATILDRIKDCLGLEYEYEGPASATFKPLGSGLTAERRAALSPDLAAPLRAAVAAGDYDSALELIARLRTHDAALAHELETMVRGYDLEAIQLWLDSGPQPASA